MMVPKSKEKLLKDGEVVAAVGGMCNVSSRVLLTPYSSMGNGSRTCTQLSRMVGSPLIEEELHILTLK
jgi:hypothetical protein